MISHIHVSITPGKLPEHLSKAFLASLLEFRTGDPAKVIVLLVRRTIAIGFHDLVLEKRGPDELGHFMERSPQAGVLFFEHPIPV
jgi:hypothetical protein